MSGLRMISPYIGRRNGVQSSPSHIPKYFNVWLHVHVDTDVIHGNDNPIKIQWVINSQFLDCRRFETTFLEYCKESIQIFLTPIPDEVVHVYQNHCILSWFKLVCRTCTDNSLMASANIFYSSSRKVNPWQNLE